MQVRHIFEGKLAIHNLLMKALIQHANWCAEKPVRLVAGKLIVGLPNELGLDAVSLDVFEDQIYQKLEGFYFNWREKVKGYVLSNQRKLGMKK